MDGAAHEEREKRLHRLVQAFQEATLRAAGEAAPLPLLAQEQMSRLRRDWNMRTYRLALGRRHSRSWLIGLYPNLPSLSQARRK